MTYTEIYKGMNRATMMHMIKMETDTCYWCSKATDAELIAGFIEIFGE